MDHRFNIERIASELRAHRALSTFAGSITARGPRVRAAAALVRVGLEIDRARSSWGERRSDGAWVERPLALLGTALGERAQDGHVVGPSSRAALLDTEKGLGSLIRRAADEAIDREGARDVQWQLLVAGGGLRGRAAMLHRVAVEIATRPDATGELVRALPASCRTEALRMARRAVLQAGVEEVFIAQGSAEELLSRFEPSVAMLRHIARQGDIRGVEIVGSRMPHHLHHLRRTVGTWLALARYAGGDARSARALLDRCARRVRDRGLAELVAVETERGRTLEAERVAMTMRNPHLRSRALGAIAERELAEGTIRHGLLRALETRGLEGALVHAERATVLGEPTLVANALERLGNELARVEPPRPWPVHPALPRGPWARALRCALVHAIATGSIPRALALPPAAIESALTSSALQVDMMKRLPSTPARLERVIERLPDELARVAPMLRALFVERWATATQVGRLIRELSEPDFERLASPATETDAFVAGVLLAPSAMRELSGSATSLLRSAYDCGVAISPHAARRATVLVRAARAAFKGPEIASGATVGWRLASLRELGAEPTALLAEIVERPATLAPHARWAALLALANVDAKLASRLFYRHFLTLAEHGRAALELQLSLERLGALPKGAALAWLGLETLLERRLGAGHAVTWWARFANRWMERRGAPPALAVFDRLGRTLESEDAHADGAVVAEHLLDAVEGWRSSGVHRILATGADVAKAGWLVVTCEPYPSDPWDVATWLETVESASRTAGQVAPDVVRAYVRRLHVDRGRVLDRLVAAAPPLSDLEEPIPLPEEPAFELSYLDKRRDFLSYMRLADCVMCCFSSRGSDYSTGLRTLRWIYRIWQDPLSFAFHVRKRSQAEPCGFVFGGFGYGEAPVLLLNGLYLKRQRASLRCAILSAIEARFARPLGISEVAVANRHAGEGLMPERYVSRKRSLTRVRALRARGGQLEWEVYDDISRFLNRPISVELEFATLN